MKASLSHLPLSNSEGSLARKLRFYIFHFHFLREVSHESFVFTSSTFIHFLREVSREMRFWKLADAPNAVFCRTKCVPEDGWETCPAGGRGTHSVRVRSGPSWPRSGTESSGVALPTFVSAAVRAILLSFAAGHCKSRAKVAIVISQFWQ